MTDISFVTAQPVDADVDPVATNITALAERLKATPKMSKGEKLFDLAIYGGLGGVGVFIGTIFLTYWSKYQGGKNVFDKAIKFLEENKISHSTAAIATNTAALSMAGNLSIIPIKAAEDNKQKIVAKLNRWLGEDPTQRITNADTPQTWWSLIKGRIVAIVAVFSSFKVVENIFGQEKFQSFENMFAEKMICKPLKKPTHIGAKIEANETVAFRLGKISALDVFATAAATALLYVGSRLFAKPSPKRMLPTDSNASLPTLLMADNGVQTTSPTISPSKFQTDHFSHTQKLMAQQELEPSDAAILR